MAVERVDAGAYGQPGWQIMGQNGSYTIYGAPDGARVEFYSQPSSYSSPSCGGTNYVTQYYNGKPSLASANPVAVKPTATTAGINAAMVAG